jgi:hypothetical protein
MKCRSVRPAPVVIQDAGVSRNPVTAMNTSLTHGSTIESAGPRHRGCTTQSGVGTESSILSRILSVLNANGKDALRQLPSLITSRRTAATSTCSGIRPTISRFA